MEGKKTLIQRALDGDGRAIDRLYDRYYSVIRRFSYHLDPHANDDRVHLVAMKVLDLLRNPEGEFDDGFPQKFTHWLYRVAEHVLLDERRRHVRKPRQLSLDQPIIPGEAPALPAAEGLSPSQAFLQQEAAELLREHIGTLPSMFREVMQLYWFDRLSHKEIADRLGVDVEVVRKRMQRAYDRLRATLRDVATTLYRRSLKR
jgi:RNA polymerase sigma-70 factor (ECF subfamily)